MDVPKKMMVMMKKKEGESYEMDEIDVPEPQGNEVLIRVDAVAICGSDIALYKWNKVGRAIARIPFIPGHETSGTVVKAGPKATLKIGQRVAIENHFYCGECYQCQNDERHICQRMNQYGHGKGTMHGGCSQYSIVPSIYCYPLTTDITPEEAVLLEPLGVAHQAMEKLDIDGEDVLIIGAGAVGLLACSVAKALGASRVLSADLDDRRLELAMEMGADLTINTVRDNLQEVVMRETNNNGIGRIAEMSGAEQMVNSQFSLLRKGGHVVMVGLPKTPLHIDNVLQDIVFKSLTLKTVHGRLIFHTWKEIERLVAEKSVDVLKIVSHRIAMSHFEEAFDALLSGKACKILLDPHQ